jgi:hypothetical protein
LRQTKGLPQAAQIFCGRFAFSTRFDIATASLGFAITQISVVPSLCVFWQQKEERPDGGL